MVAEDNGARNGGVGVVRFVPYLLSLGYAAPLAATLFASADLLRSFGLAP